MFALSSDSSATPRGVSSAFEGLRCRCAGQRRCVPVIPRTVACRRTHSSQQIVTRPRSWWNASCPSWEKCSGSNVWVLDQPKQPPASKPRLWFSHDAGASFTDFPSAPNEGKITAIGGSQAGELVVAHNGHVYERTPEANTWTELTNGAFAVSSKITALAVPAPHHVIAVGDQGVILDIRPESGKL